MKNPFNREPLERLLSHFHFDFNKRNIDMTLVLAVVAVTVLGFVVLSSATLTYGNRPR